MGDEDFEQDALTEHQMHSVHKGIDANKDGKISMSEVMEFAAAMRKKVALNDVRNVMDEMDSNKDGKLDLKELLDDMEQWGENEEGSEEKDARLKMETQKFKLADADGNGYLTQQELPALFYPETHDGVLTVTAEATMKVKDKNGDGKLTLQEFWEGDTASEGESLPISDEEVADFAKLDINSDQLLDLDELKPWEAGTFHTQEAVKKLFSIADVDGDSLVSQKELGDAREKIATTDAQYHLMEWTEHIEL